MNGITNKNSILKDEWVKIEHPDIIAINVNNAASQGIKLESASGIYAFNNAALTNNTGISKTLEIMNGICDMNNTLFGKHFIASYQAQYGATLVTDGTTLSRIKAEGKEDQLLFALPGKDN